MAQIALPDFMTAKPAAAEQPALTPVPDFMGKGEEKQLPGFMTTKPATAASSDAQPIEPPISVMQDIKNVTPGAARTGAELAVPTVGAAEASRAAPWLIRGVLSQLNSMGLVVGGDETMKEFDQAYAETKAGEIPNDFGLPWIRQYTDPILGEHQEVPAQTLPGKIVKTGLEVAPSIMTGPGTLLQKTLMAGTVPAATEGAGAATEALGGTPGQVEAARFVGGLGGGFSPSIWNRAVNPRPIRPSRQPHIDVLDAHNVPISAGQRTGDKRLLLAEDMAGGPAAYENQGEAFTRAAGEIQEGFQHPGILTRSAMRAELDRMGAEFQRLIGGRSHPFDAQLQNDLLDATIGYQRDNPLVAPVVEDIMNDLATNAGQNQGNLTGAAVQNTRAKVNKMVRDENTDQGVRGALMDLQDALDEAISRGLSPEDAHAFRRVRAQYRNFLPIEHARAAPGAAAAEGIINPQSLSTGIKTMQGKREVAAGEQPLTELAEAGKVGMPKEPSSRTAERMRAMLAGLMPILSGGGAAAMGLAHDAGGPLATALGAGGAAAGVALPFIKDAAIVSDIGQRFLGRQGPRVPTTREGLAAMVAAARAAQQREEGDRFRR